MRAPETTRESSVTTIGGKYRVVGVLGVGAMATVYEADNEWTGRRVAIKLLRPDLKTDSMVVQRFIQEAKAATAIRHPNIVDVLDMGLDRGTGSFYIVQELLAGEDLRTWMTANRSVPAREAFALLLPVMNALEVAHAHGIVHRDIKPENIVLTRSPSGELVPKVIDFGISKILGGGASLRTTDRGCTIGTPEYMSPEQARGESSIDGRADVWSVGMVLYELLCGHVPYEGDDPNLILLAIVNDPVRRIETRLPDLSPAIAAIIHKAVARERSERYPDMQAFVADVTTCREIGLAVSTPRASGVVLRGQIAGNSEARDVGPVCDIPTLDDPAFEVHLPPRRQPITVAAFLAVAVLATRWVPASSDAAGANAVGRHAMHHATWSAPVAALLVRARGNDSPRPLVGAPDQQGTSGPSASFADPPRPPTAPACVRPWSPAMMRTAPTRDPRPSTPTRAASPLDPLTVIRRHHVIVE